LSGKVLIGASGLEGSACAKGNVPLKDCQPGECSANIY
jgi:hypothetical protein